MATIRNFELEKVTLDLAIHKHLTSNHAFQIFCVQVIELYKMSGGFWLRFIVDSQGSRVEDDV